MRRIIHHFRLRSKAGSGLKKDSFMTILPGPTGVWTRATAGRIAMVAVVRLWPWPPPPGRRLGSCFSFFRSHQILL